MTHKDAPPETATQRECREWWTKREPHVTRNWSRTKTGGYHAVESQALQDAWDEAHREGQRSCATGYAGAMLWRGRRQITLTRGRDLEHTTDPDQAFVDTVQQALNLIAKGD